MPKSHLVFQTLLLALVVLLCAFAYQLALPGIWLYDDGPSLRGLEQVHDWLSGMVYTLDGFTGPLGRPLALATFALQAEHWPDNPAAFLRVNILIHCLNALLVFAVTLVLGRFLAPESHRAGWFALVVTALWAFSPFLASASLMVVQRMATLSATFVFLGVLIYTYGRWISVDRPRAGLVLVSTAVLVFTPLAAFAKENGALLPVLLLLVEMLVVRPSSATRARLPGWWLALFLALPTVLILGYLASRGIGGGGYGHRDFDLNERLLTQARIVWDYLFNLVLPRSAAVTPFMDGYPKSTGWLSPATTLASIIALTIAAVSWPWLAKALPVLAFAIAWYLGAQLLESTVIPLELYFAHRTYVAAFGVYLAIAYLMVLSTPARRTPKLAAAVAVAYAAALLGVLVSSTSLWSKPDLAAEMWYLRSETSTRAALNLASIYQTESDHLAADRVVQNVRRFHPESQLLTTYSVQFCFRGREDFETRRAAAEAALTAPAAVEFSSALLFHRLAMGGAATPCPYFQPAHLHELIQISLAEPQRHRSTRTTVYLHYAQAQLAQEQGDFSTMRQALKSALELEPDPQTVTLIAFAWIQEGEMEQARQFLQQALSNPPQGRLQQHQWDSEITEYLNRLRD